MAKPAEQSPMEPQEKSIPGVTIGSNELVALRSLCSDLKLDNRVKSRSLMDGAARSSRRGRGMEFAEVRHYQPGDDIRNIDWRVTARTQETYTKLFQEEKERPVYLVIDQRSDMFFGSKVQFKSVLAAKLSAVIAWSAFMNRDKLGALIFNEYKQSDFRAKQGKTTLFKFFRDLSNFNQYLFEQHRHEKSHSAVENHSLPKMLQELQLVVKPGSLIYILSDFHDFDSDAHKALSLLSRHNDIEMIQIIDPLESAIPKTAKLPISRKGKRLVIDSTLNTFQKAYGKQWNQHQEYLDISAMSLGLCFTRAMTDKEISEQLKYIFNGRPITRK